MPEPPRHTRRPRYAGRNPRTFDEKYKELDPARYESEVEKVMAAGKTPAGTHRPIMVEEVLECLRPSTGDVAVDCTLGGGGHARAILERIWPGGRLIGLDADPIELPRTEASLREAGFDTGTFTAHVANFAGLHRVLDLEGLQHADVILADLGVSSMQLDNPARGFGYKVAGPLDMRMNPSRGEPASRLIERLDEEALATILDEHADEPHAAFIAAVIKQEPIDTTHLLERLVRTALTGTLGLDKAEAKNSIRRTFQALRIAVNDEFSKLDALLRALPLCLASGGRAAIITFHSGEDRRVKKAFQAGQRDGLYSDIAGDVIRPGMAETRANRRSASAKLRWVVRA
ncbi:MAG: 16S rRNA (cytosine(1402)-N(4))-methyltransferase RsmH [Acidobacteriota bacterium]|nr:16S rRNA (cytosine(1402)-N(4))-methyltransferase RsmH [Acidobacteriota bacterium]